MTFNEGDRVYVVTGTWRENIGRDVISRVTKTQAIVGIGAREERFNRENGRMIGSTGFAGGYISLPSPSLDSRYQKRRGEALASRLSMVAQKVSRGEVESKAELHAAIQEWLDHEEGDQ